MALTNLGIFYVLKLLYVVLYSKRSRNSYYNHYSRFYFLSRSAHWLPHRVWNLRTVAPHVVTSDKDAY